MLNDGMSPPAALKAAKEKMWNHPRWRHPFYWAAFVIQGEYMGTIKYDANRSSRSFSVVKVGAVTGLLMLFMGLYLTHKRKRRRIREQAGG
jgi:hypothetical protein